MRICSMNMPSLPSTQLFMYFQMDPKSVFKNPFTEHTEHIWENKVNLNITNTDQYVALILIKDSCFNQWNQVLRRLPLLSMSYCCRKRKHWSKMTKLWYCESRETQISTVSTGNDLGLAHLPWHRDHLDDLLNPCQNLFSMISQQQRWALCSAGAGRYLTLLICHLRFSS